MASPKQRPQKILLAVDLKADNFAATKHVWETAKLIGSDRAAILPVAVLNREDAAVGNILKGSIGKLSSAAANHLDAQLRKLGLRNLKASSVLFADGSSTTRAVQALVHHAQKNKCDLIALGSHSRKGLERLLLGSFAETLSLTSPLPLLIVNPHYRPPTGKLRTVLFPTDFSPQSKLALKAVGQSLRGTSTQLTLYHQFETAFQPYPEPFVGVPLPREAIEEERKLKETLGQEWCSELKKQGVRAQWKMNVKPSRTSDAILDFAHRSGMGLIALTSHTGKFGNLIFGSVTRQVMRNSSVPVWVLPPRKK
jgi:nucleotide-binding universal stress UspA family protein